MTLDEAKPIQLILFDPRHICDRCTEIMNRRYGYYCCPLGFNPYIYHPNPKEALCQLERKE